MVNLTFNFNGYEPYKTAIQGRYVWVNPTLYPDFKRSSESAREMFIGLKDQNSVADLLEIPVGQLLYVLYSQQNNYKSFTVRKKSGKERLIESPNASLKILQNKVKPLIEEHYRVKKPVHGFVGSGKGIISNAEQHKKKLYVLNIDLEDFFHSVNFGRVQGIFRNKPFNMGYKAATVLAQVCTHNGRLPQGASTSPVISNLAAASLDKRLVTLAKKFHLTYTRYADDLTFSSNRVFPKVLIEKEIQDNGLYKYRIGSVLEQAILDSGSKVNHSKTRLQHKSQRQEVTGLVVNEGVNVNRKFIRKTRAMINEWRKDLVAAEIRFIKSRYHVADHDIDLEKLNGSIFKRAVYGNLSFIRMVKGEEHSPYLTLCKQVLELDVDPPEFVSKLKGVFEMFDIFICHASEDKQQVAIPLYKLLTDNNINAFMDCFEIKWGDSLVAKINTALQKSKFVIAIISENSITKAWPMKEINSVLSLEISQNHTKLLPLLVGDEAELLDRLPLLNDKLFETFDNNMGGIVDKVKSLLENV